MKKSLSILFALFTGAGIAAAGNGWGIFASYWNPSDGDDTVGAGAKIEIGISEDVDLELRGSYFDDLGEDTSLEVIPLEAGLTLTLPGSQALDFYAGGGLGYYLADADSNPDNEIGFYLTAGLEWALRANDKHWGGTDTVIFSELLYRSVGIDDADASGGDVDLDGIGVNIGLLIRW